MRSCQVMKATMVLFSSTYDALFRNAGVGLETWVTHWWFRGCHMELHHMQLFLPRSMLSLVTSTHGASAKASFNNIHFRYPLEHEFHYIEDKSAIWYLGLPEDQWSMFWSLVQITLRKVYGFEIKSPWSPRRFVARKRKEHVKCSNLLLPGINQSVQANSRLFSASISHMNPIWA